jgi:beta-glucuronidase
VDGRTIDYVEVPGSYRPIGQCLLEFEFDSNWPARPEKGDRYFLVTEGVLASAAFSLNGQSLGNAGPWANYRFELPAGSLRPGKNTMSALVRDIVEAFGPTPGRRFDAGLVRKIWIERRPSAFLERFCFTAELSPDLASADCTVAVDISGPAQPAQILLTESATGREIFRGQASPDRPVRFRVEYPRLWSPTMPNLYELTATLNSDSIREHVGFRRIETRGPDFFLNNQRLLLKGVCRHEFNFASGYSPSDAEVRLEMERIKHAGFNYVRLVHSPHGPIACRVAAQIGLLVSEEPGTCFHNLGDEAIAAPAVESLRRTILRDRNVPSIFAWLIYNECDPNTEYAVRIAKMCRELDPGCRLAMADCSNKNEEIKAMVAAADLTFYGINIYSYWPKDYSERMKVFTDRPMIYTEWGGVFGQGNPRVLKDLCDSFVIHSREGESVRVAGCTFWAWADYEEYSRQEPAAIDGWTIEGLVDRDGKRKPDLQILSDMCFDFDHPPVKKRPVVEVICPAPQRKEKWESIALDEVKTEQGELEKAIDAMRLARLKYTPWVIIQDPVMPPLPRFGRLLVDGIDFRCRDERHPARPLLLGKGCDRVIIPIGRKVSAIAVLGHVAIRGGYPASNIFSVHHRDAEPSPEPGDPCAEYQFLFENGEETEPLRHGLEILRSNDICRWWTPSPRSPHTRPGVRSVIDKSSEVLRMDLWEHRLPSPRYLKAIAWKLVDEQSILLMHALSVEVE